MKTLVTGANGYIGMGVVKQLVEDGIEVIATDYTTKLVDPRATRVGVDLFSVEDPYTFFGEPDVLLHLAWKDGFKHESLNHIIDLPKHYEFINKLVLSKIHRICILGSMHEVGFYEGSINETTPANPESLYGISKNALRQATDLLCKKNDIKMQWIRGFYIVGNSEYGCSIFSKITQAAKEKKKEFPFTLGRNQFDFIDYDLFCRQVAAVVEQDKFDGIINCCSGIPMKLSERVEQFIKEHEYNIKLIYGAFPDRPYDSKAVWGDDEKIKSVMQNYNMVKGQI